MTRVFAVAVVIALFATGCGSMQRKDRASGTTSTAKAVTTHAQAAKRQPRLAVRANRAIRKLIGYGKAVYCGGRHGNAVALTFDDGPGPYTHFALKRLRRNNGRATFFLVARNLPMFGSLVAKEQLYGEVGDHTRTHPFLPALAPDAQRSEIAGAQQAIEQVAGRPVRLFRAPYGSHNAQIDALVAGRQMLEVLWNVDSADSLGANYKQITQNVIAGMHPGSIILMHENRGQTIRALPTILHALRRRHLRAVTIPEMLATNPPTRAQLSKGLAGCRHFSEVGDTLTHGAAKPG